MRSGAPQRPLPRLNERFCYNLSSFLSVQIDIFFQITQYKKHEYAMRWKCFVPQWIIFSEKRRLTNEQWKNTVLYGNRQKTSPSFRSLSQVKDNQTSAFCPQILWNFWSTLLDLCWWLSVWCMNSSCRSWSAETTAYDDAWPTKAFRILPAIHFACWVRNTSIICFVF